jgi:hypothetical protein
VEPDITYRVPDLGAPGSLDRVRDEFDHVHERNGSLTLDERQRVVRHVVREDREVRTGVVQYA